jgi:hypothetical protein
MAFDPTGHIDGKSLMEGVLASLQAERDDPDGFLEYESHRNEHAKPVTMDSPIPKPPPLNPDGSEQEEAETPESKEPWLVVPAGVLDLLEEQP